VLLKEEEDRTILHSALNMSFAKLN